MRNYIQMDGATTYSTKLMLTFIIAVFVQWDVVFGKIESNGEDNLNWPKFFNPKLSILREIDEKKETLWDQELEDEDDQSNQTSLQASQITNQLNEYTRKGQLRGTYFLLNSPPSFETLSEEMINTIEMITKIDEDTFNEADKNLLNGETTEEGVKMKTPLITRTHSPNLGKYGARISFFGRDNAPTKLIYFGNWCGKGGRSAPVDNIDGCCLEQVKCYGKLVGQCPDVWIKPFQMMYAWTLVKGDPLCVRSESSCINGVCECDREASLCFRHYTQNQDQIPLHFDSNATPVEPEKITSQTSF